MRTGRAIARASLMCGERNSTHARLRTDRSDDSWSRTIRNCATKPNVREMRKFGLVFEHPVHVVGEMLDFSEV